MLIAWIKIIESPTNPMIAKLLRTIAPWWCKNCVWNLSKLNGFQLTLTDGLPWSFRQTFKLAKSLILDKINQNIHFDSNERFLSFSKQINKITQNIARYSTCVSPHNFARVFSFLPSNLDALISISFHLQQYFHFAKFEKHFYEFHQPDFRSVYLSEVSQIPDVYLQMSFEFKLGRYTHALFY